MDFQLCENTGFWLRVALIGPAGSGKTYTALSIAAALGFDKIGVIDTENRSARRYARTFGKRFQSLELSHFSPRDYIEAIRTAEAAGIEVLIVDSLSHAWAGKGGVLEMVDQSAKRQSRGGAPSSFSGWREVTPEHNRLVEALVQARLHLIITMRTKTEYVIDKDDKGRAVPRKVGLQPVQRDGLEYEFDIVGDMSPDHELVISKTRLPALAGAVLPKPGAELAQQLRAWVDGAQGPPPAAPDWIRRIAEIATHATYDETRNALWQAMQAGEAPGEDSPAGKVLIAALTAKKRGLSSNPAPAQAEAGA